MLSRDENEICLGLVFHESQLIISVNINVQIDLSVLMVSVSLSVRLLVVQRIFIDYYIGIMKNILLFQWVEHGDHDQVLITKQHIRNDLDDMLGFT
jgi:hypothetical protein